MARSKFRIVWLLFVLFCFISRSALGSNMYTYLKFGLPRVFPPNHNGSNRSGTPQHFQRVSSTRPHMRLRAAVFVFFFSLFAIFCLFRTPKAGSRGPRDGSSGYDSSDNETTNQYKQNRKYRSDPDFRMQNVHPSYHVHGVRLFCYRRSFV